MTSEHVEGPGGELVGKCSSRIGLDDAQRILERGVGWYPRGHREKHPQRIYGVHEGVVYRGVPTVPGQTYHGFPEHPDKLPSDRELVEELLRLAREEGADSLEHVKRWLP